MKEDDIEKIGMEVARLIMRITEQIKESECIRKDELPEFLASLTYTIAEMVEVVVVEGETAESLLNKAHALLIIALHKKRTDDARLTL